MSRWAALLSLGLALGAGCAAPSPSAGANGPGPGPAGTRPSDAPSVWPPPWYSGELSRDRLDDRGGEPWAALCALGTGPDREAARAAALEQAHARARAARGDAWPWVGAPRGFALRAAEERPPTGSGPGAGRAAAWESAVLVRVPMSWLDPVARLQAFQREFAEGPAKAPDPRARPSDDPRPPGARPRGGGQAAPADPTRFAAGRQLVEAYDAEREHELARQAADWLASQPGAPADVALLAADLHERRDRKHEAVRVLHAADLALAPDDPGRPAVRERMRRLLASWSALTAELDAWVAARRDRDALALTAERRAEGAVVAELLGPPGRSTLVLWEDQDGLFLWAWSPRGGRVGLGGQGSPGRLRLVALTLEGAPPAWLGPPPTAQEQAPRLLVDRARVDALDPEAVAAFRRVLALRADRAADVVLGD